jgi:hypothetical protein
MADGLNLTFTGNPVINIGLTEDQVQAVITAALEASMSAVDDALATIGTSLDELVKDVQRLIALFEAGGNLTPEQQAAVDALKAKTDAIDAAVEAAAPETPL